jgi:intracellular sulfur oxidation DsrE/DsrF family protein
MRITFVYWKLLMVSSSKSVLRGLLIVICLVWISPGALASDNQREVDNVLKMGAAPLGVVFEIVEGDPNALKWAIPQVVKFSKQLRDQFPDIAIAVVSHGKEQFALMKEEEQENGKVHKAVKSLLAQDVPVHVCGTHASWYGKTADDFPDYVDVTPAGPTQIANYEDMGYHKIVLEKPGN